MPCSNADPRRQGERDAMYTWPDVKQYHGRPLLSPTLVIDNTPQQLADKLGGLQISGGILLDAKRTQEKPYDKAHRLLAETVTALMALETDHTGAREVADAVTDALILFEDTVRDRPVFGEELALDGEEPTLEQEEADAEFRAALRGAA